MKRVPWLVVWRAAVLSLLIWVAYDLHSSMPEDSSHEVDNLSSQISRLQRSVESLEDQVRSLTSETQALRWRR